MMHTLVTGGTGSIGRVLVERLLQEGKEVLVLSRDEAKQHQMRAELPDKRLHFQIGDIRDPDAVTEAVRGVINIIHCAALKHVPICEEAPLEAVQTNIIGTQNLIRAVVVSGQINTLVAFSTDKACKPIGVMGYTKAIMERLLIRAHQLRQCHTRFFILRLGNVVPSRGSVFPLFQKLVSEGKPLGVTSRYMTRFLVSLNNIPDLLASATHLVKGGEILVPELRSAYIEDIARIFIGTRSIPVTYTGIRPGEKIDEFLVSEKEVARTRYQDGFFIIQPFEIPLEERIPEEYCSRYHTLGKHELRIFLNEALGMEL